jgi:hypothetical protein
MPQLINGHLRFTNDDFLMNDYKETSIERYKNQTSEKLAARLKENSEQLALMKDTEVVRLFNTEQNIKKILADSLLILSAIAEREGYDLTELMRL